MYNAKEQPPNITTLANFTVQNYQLYMNFLPLILLAAVSTEYHTY